MVKFILSGCLVLITTTGFSQGTSPGKILTHSHNDYLQAVPFVTAYQARMNSIEADVFILNGDLVVAHVPEDIVPGKTLKSVYLEPLYQLYMENGEQPYPNDQRSLQLVIDIKQNYAEVIPLLMHELQAYPDMIDPKRSKKPVKIVLSGDLPPPDQFKNYPAYLCFDGKPGLVYTPQELKRVSLFSDELQTYTAWNGIGELSAGDQLKLKKVIAAAHHMEKPFRFWGTPDDNHGWKVLENLGADWIGTDHPEMLHSFLEQQVSVPE